MSTQTDLDAVETVARRSAEFVAMMLSYLAKTIMESLGNEKGEAILRKGLREFGKARGRGIRENLDSLGLKPTVENFGKYYDFPMFAGFKVTREIIGDGRHSMISFCPLGNFWKETEDKQIGLIYCDEVDDGIREGFDPNLKHKNLKNPMRGDPICEHIDEYCK